MMLVRSSRRRRSLLAHCQNSQRNHAESSPIPVHSACQRLTPSNQNTTPITFSDTIHRLNEPKHSQTGALGGRDFILMKQSSVQTTSAAECPLIQQEFSARSNFKSNGGRKVVDTCLTQGCNDQLFSSDGERHSTSSTGNQHPAVNLKPILSLIHTETGMREQTDSEMKTFLLLICSTTVLLVLRQEKHG